METKFEELLGKTIVEITGMLTGSDRIDFKCSDGSEYVMLHRQDCCEDVYIEDIEGDYADLLNSPITLASESSNSDNKPEWAESHTWTFYKLATIKGYVDIRWLGTSNGWYSERVDFYKV
jgi:hypothetical protein